MLLVLKLIMKLCCNEIAYKYCMSVFNSIDPCLLSLSFFELISISTHMWFIYFSACFCIGSLTLALHVLPLFSLTLTPTEGMREVLLSCFTSSVFPTTTTTTTTTKMCAYVNNGLFFTLHSFREEKSISEERLPPSNFEQLALSNYFAVTSTALLPFASVLLLLVCLNYAIISSWLAFLSSPLLISL